MNNQSLKQLLRTLFALTVFIIICGFLVRTLADSETLSDYAAKNPEQAYGTGKENINDREKEDPENETPENETPENEDPEESGGPVSMAENTKPDTQPDDIIEISPDRIVYQEGFYYESLTESVKSEITGISYPTAAEEISYDELRYLSVLHYDFNGEVQTGELICNQGIAEDLAEIFYELYVNEYRIEKIRLIDEYQGDDTASMADNNTSCFNYRVVDGTTNLSKHALGCAIDINPFYNPYVVFNKEGSGETYISPAGSEIYADRSKDFPYKIDENDLCYKLFMEHGFIWGGHWNSSKDYQHFQKVVE